MNIIRPDLLCGKLDEFNFIAAAASLETAPARLKELLWFLQSVSLERNGIELFVKSLLSKHCESFVSTGMLKAGLPQEGRYSIEQCLIVWKAEMQRTFNFNPFRDEKLRQYGIYESCNFSEWSALLISPEMQAEDLAGTTIYNKIEILKGVERFNYSHFKKKCEDSAQAQLPKYLADLCTEKNTQFRGCWYCPSLIALLLNAMDQHTAARLQSIAQTSVTKIVFRELEFALESGVPVPLVGESRIGKTSPASAWCSMRPGRARLVRVPGSNRIRDLMEAFATAYGIEFTARISTPSLTNQVKYAIQHSGLFIAFDEFHNAIPLSYGKTTPPIRLEFVRGEVIDRDVGCAFLATPQNYRQSIENYVKVTGYCIKQWLGRCAEPKVLPAELCKNDLLSVARLNFPAIAEPFLALICARAMRSQVGIKNVEITAKRALFIARENGRIAPNLMDVETAIVEMMSGECAAEPSRPPAPVASRPIAVRPQPRRAANAARLQPVREIAPAAPEILRGSTAEANLSDRSLQSICPNLRDAISLEATG